MQILRGLYPSKWKEKKIRIRLLRRALKYWRRLLEDESIDHGPWFLCITVKQLQSSTCWKLNDVVRTRFELRYGLWTMDYPPFPKPHTRIIPVAALLNLNVYNPKPP